MNSSDWEVLLPAEIDPVGPESLSDIAATVSIDEYDDREALLEDASRFEAVITRIERLDAEFIDHATSLEIISKHGVGTDNIDVPAATEHDVIVTNTPGVNSRAVAEHAITLTMAVRRRLLEADRNVRAGDEHDFVTDELRNDTVGLFGCGDIGLEVATLASGLGMSCLTYDPYVDESELPAYVTTVDSPEALFERGDVVSVHTPLTSETRHAISHAEFNRMSSSDILINTARAEVVDREALVAALESKSIAGAGIDVFADTSSHETPLSKYDNVVLTPHVGAQTTEALHDASVESAANVRTVYNGERPDTAINAHAH
ncbi:hydroxyacid dehydrogenase [Natronorubrum sp. FCH18a]|uniref:hydroxyacid dehydrogenase n=1 Tax=Natronorubrum sp. FCH18a TaxID=3447018 RepID=UPI003F51376C